MSVVTTDPISTIPTADELVVLFGSLLQRIDHLEQRLARPSAPVLDGLLTAQDLADRLRHKNTRRIDEWRVTGEGPKYVRAGKTPYYRPEDVDAWLLSNIHSSTREEL